MSLLISFICGLLFEIFLHPFIDMFVQFIGAKANIHIAKNSPPEEDENNQETPVVGFQYEVDEEYKEE